MEALITAATECLNPRLNTTKHSSQCNPNSFGAANAETLSALFLPCLQSSLPHDLIRLLIRPKLEIIRAVPWLANLPRHPRNPQIIEHINVVLQSLRFTLTGSAKLLEKDELFRLQRMLQSNWAFGPELFYAAVRVDVDKVEGVAGPVLRDVGVGELVAAAWWLCWLAVGAGLNEATRALTSGN